MTEFVQSKKGKITIAIIILVLLGLIIGMLLLDGPNDKDKEGNKVNIETDEPDREVFEKDENTVEEEHEDGLTVVEEEDADVDSSDFAEFPEVDEDGNVVSSGEGSGSGNGSGSGSGEGSGSGSGEGSGEGSNEGSGEGDEEQPSTGEAWGPFF